MFESSQVIFAFALTILAGVATGVGSLMAFFSKRFNGKFLAGSLGFSAGVMVYVSLVEIFAKSRLLLVHSYGEQLGYWYTVLSFFGGIGIIALIDRVIPNYENPHEIKLMQSDEYKEKRLMRMGLFSALAIAIHNFPEGLVTFMGALSDPTLGVSIAVAVAIHNIPEGIVVSVPVYYATKSKAKAFWISLWSGLAEPIGALVGYLVLRQWFSDTTFGVMFAIVAGIMVYIAMDELLPTAEEYGEHHVAISGFIGGMAVMAISLVLFV